MKNMLNMANAYVTMIVTTRYYCQPLTKIIKIKGKKAKMQFNSCYKRTDG